MSAARTSQRQKAAYDRLLGLPYPGWGWEYKRRDIALIDAARKSRRRNVSVHLRRDGSYLIRMRHRDVQAEQFGLHFIPDPNLSAFETTPFWLPEVMTGGLDAAAEVIELSPNLDPLNWLSIPGEKHFLIAPGPRTKLVIAAPGYAAQLAIAENALPVPQSIYLSLRLGKGDLVGANLAHVEAFARHCHGQNVPFPKLRGLSPEALRDGIIALDRKLAGLSQRRIAEVIYGADVVSDDWDYGPGSYRLRVRRLIRKGLHLMKTGYRDLL
ncbi:MAG: DUF2285 domain-containing protein [Pseudomonadota bacterium]